MKSHFDIGTFGSSRFNDKNTNMLGRLINAFIKAVNAKKRLPKVIIVLLHGDFIDELGLLDNKISIAASLLGTWTEWFAKEVSEVITNQLQALPMRAVRQGEPIVYWPAIPTHQDFSYGKKTLIAKFNNCLDSVIKLYDNMRIIKIKEG